MSESRISGCHVLHPEIQDLLKMHHIFSFNTDFLDHCHFEFSISKVPLKILPNGKSGKTKTRRRTVGFLLIPLERVPKKNQIAIIQKHLFWFLLSFFLVRLIHCSIIFCFFVFFGYKTHLLVGQKTSGFRTQRSHNFDGQKKGRQGAPLMKN